MLEDMKKDGKDMCYEERLRTRDKLFRNIKRTLQTSVLSGAVCMANYSGGISRDYGTRRHIFCNHAASTYGGPFTNCNPTQ